MKEETTTLGYENTTLTVYFSKGVKAGVSVRETDERRWRETKTNCHIDP